MVISDKVIILESIEDFNELSARHNFKGTFDELYDYLWYGEGIVLLKCYADPSE